MRYGPIILLVVGVALIGAPKIVPYIQDQGPASVVAADPTPELQKEVLPIRTLMSQNAQKAEFAGFCTAAADTIQRDNGTVIRTAEDLQQYNLYFSNLRFAKNYTPVPGLAEAMNTAMLNWVGNKAGELTPERRRKAVEVYLAFAWAAQ